MKINQNFNDYSLVNFKNGTLNTSNDPFDLNLETTQLKLNNQGAMAPVTSMSLCTPGCGNTGTGNSFCC